jgi:aspartyl-tRNA synthetase
MLARRCALSAARALGAVRSLTQRTGAGTLRAELEGDSVELAGWVQAVREYGAFTFVSLRDHSGVAQLVIDGGGGSKMNVDQLRLESVISVSGRVSRRPADMENSAMPTGEVEVSVEALSVLNSAAPMPLKISEDHALPTEEARLRHRFLDLRRPLMQHNLRVRSAVAMAARLHLASEGFAEIETPTLFKSTPEGAREFLVPTRTRGAFFALPQSPQQYKQMLMVGGVDRYFQVARCYRDEGGRADRQPEFTQIDIEASFVDEAEVMALVEGLVRRACAAAMETSATVADALAMSAATRPPALRVPLVGGAPFERMTYREAVDRFGSDKPDLRLGMEFCEVGSALGADTEAKLFATARAGGGAVRAIKVPGLALGPTEEVAAAASAATGGKKGKKGANNAASGSGGFTRRDADALAAAARQPLAWAVVEEPADGASGGDSPLPWRSPLAKQLTDGERASIARAVGGVAPGDVLLFAPNLGPGGEADPASVDACCNALGRARLGAAALLKDVGRLELDPTEMRFLWVTDFPMFEPAEAEEGEVGGAEMNLKASHHPFVAPQECAMDTVWGADAPLDRDARRLALLGAKGRAYDLTLNGWELGGGSIRIHNSDLQRHVFQECLELPPAQVNTFEHLLTALSLGAPPHGGIALGLDRLTALLCSATNLRDVIAFPKSTAGRELMTGGPGAVTDAQLDEYHIAVTDPQSSADDDQV